MTYGLASAGLAPFCLVRGEARAQATTIAKFADIAGVWTGRVDPAGMKLKLTLQPDGKFDLLQSLLMEYNNSGKAVLKNGGVVLPLGTGDAVLKLTADGKLTGPYAGERIKGTATLAKQ